MTQKNDQEGAALQFWDRIPAALQVWTYPQKFRTWLQQDLEKTRGLYK